MTLALYVLAFVDDPSLVDALKTSGPAGALVVMLGGFIRAWLAEMKTAIGELRAELREATSRANAATASSIEGRFRLENLERRMTAIEDRNNAHGAVHRTPV